PLLWQRRPLRLVQRQLQGRETEQRALEPDRRQRDTDLLEQLVAWQSRDFGGTSSLHHLGEHRCRRLRDRAPSARELDLVDRVAVLTEGDEDRDLVAAERVLAL